MGGRTTLLLVALVVLTAAALWRDPDARQLLVALVTGEELQPPPPEIVPLVSFSPADVLEVEVHAAAGNVVAQRRDDGWEGPLGAKAVDDFLRALGGVGRVSHIPLGDRELAEFGLEEPARSVVLVRRHPLAPLRIDVGRDNPASTAVYVRVDRVGPIVLAGAVLTWEIDKFASRGAATAPRP